MAVRFLDILSQKLLSDGLVVPIEPNKPYSLYLYAKGEKIRLKSNIQCIFDVTDTIKIYIKDDIPIVPYVIKRSSGADELLRKCSTLGLEVTVLMQPR